MNIPKIAFIANTCTLYLHFVINNKYLEIIYNLGDKTILYYLFNRISSLLESKTEKRNSQCEHGQPMAQTRSLFRMCDSNMVRGELHGK